MKYLKRLLAWWKTQGYDGRRDMLGFASGILMILGVLGCIFVRMRVSEFDPSYDSAMGIPLLLTLVGFVLTLHFFIPPPGSDRDKNG